MKAFVLLMCLILAIVDCAAQTNEDVGNIGFKRGDKIIFTDNFSKDAIGDFPAKWGSTQGGEIKKITGFEEKFLKVPGGSIINLQLGKPLPEDFTLDYDMVLPAEVGTVVPSICFGETLEKPGIILTPRKGLQLTVIRTGRKGFSDRILYGSGGGALNKIDYVAATDKKIHVGFMVNGSRIRMYVDGKKMLDLPTQFINSFRKNIYLSSPTNGWAETKTGYFYATNFMLAETGKDARSQVVKDLFENGEASTTAIQFKVNSDAILAESDLVINELVTGMKANAAVTIKIIGHTDSDGDAVKNMELSKKRANAVKMKMVSLGIAQNRITTDGEGESNPIADNATAEGKAQNRRVVFMKTN